MHVANNTMPVRYDKFCTIPLYCLIKALFYILHIITVDTARSRAMPFL